MVVWLSRMVGYRNDDGEITKKQFEQIKKDTKLDHEIRSRSLQMPGAIWNMNLEMILYEARYGSPAGKSTPVTKQAEAKVIGGSVNGEGSLTVEVQKGTAEQSIL